MSWFHFICTNDELVEVLENPEIQELIIGYQIFGNYQVKVGYEDFEENLRANLSLSMWFGQEPKALDPRTRIENGRYAGACHLQVPEIKGDIVNIGAMAYDDKWIQFDVPPARPAYMIVRRALKKMCPYQTIGDKRIGGPFPRVSGTIRDLILEKGYIKEEFGNRFYFEKPAE